jgi:hypothetical protein
MSAEGWTALATVVIAVATIAYMAVSIFQGRMMLKSFRLNLLQTLTDMVTSKDTDVASAVIREAFVQGCKEAFPRDYEEINKAISSARDNLPELVRQRMEQAIEIERIVREGRQKLFSSRPDPFLGMCADEPELIDQITESAMQAREQHPLRQTGG